MEAVEIISGLKIRVPGDLEKWRAETFFSKEPETIAWLKKYRTLGLDFFDIGANIGVYSLFAAHLNTEGAIYSFEPVLNNFLALAENISLNSFPNVTPVYAGLNENSGVQKIYVRDSRTGNSGAQLGQAVDEKGAIFEPVSVNTVLAFSLDDLVSRMGFPVPGIMKIDVDGLEETILRGAANLLTDSRLKSVLIESNGEKSGEFIHAWLTARGLFPDGEFNDRPDHSSVRRRGKSENVARNLVFTRKQEES